MTKSFILSGSKKKKERRRRSQLVQGYVQGRIFCLVYYLLLPSIAKEVQLKLILPQDKIFMVSMVTARSADRPVTSVWPEFPFPLPPQINPLNPHLLNRTPSSERKKIKKLNLHTRCIRGSEEHRSGRNV